MPRTGFQTSPALQVKIDDDQIIYFPGDTVQGNVTYSKPADQQAFPPSIRITLFGRAKTKYSVKTQNGTAVERGRASLFLVRKTIRLDASSEDKPHLWPFSVTIPEHSMPGMNARGDQFRPSPGYLHTTDAKTKLEIDVTRHPLPTTMYYFADSAMSGKTSECYIEYILMAEAGSAKVTIPLYIRQRSTESPITTSNLQQRSFTRFVKTLRLLPEYAEGPIPRSKSFMSSFRPSKVPQYFFNVRVTFPARIQLEHPDVVQMRMHIIPIMEPEQTTISTDGKTDQLPPVTMTSMDLKLDGYVNIRCPGTLWDSSNEKHHTFAFPMFNISKPAVIPVFPPLRPGESMDNNAAPTHKPSDELQLGSHFALRLGTSSCSVLGRPPASFKRQILPSFHTYNISVHYSLSWKIRLSCAGETHSVSGESPIRVLAPSEEQENLKEQELGNQGMKKKWENLESGLELGAAGISFISQILSAVAG